MSVCENGCSFTAHVWGEILVYQLLNLTYSDLRDEWKCAANVDVSLPYSLVWVRCGGRECIPSLIIQSLPVPLIHVCPSQLHKSNNVFFSFSREVKLEEKKTCLNFVITELCSKPVVIQKSLVKDYIYISELYVAVSIFSNWPALAMKCLKDVLLQHSWSAN